LLLICPRRDGSKRRVIAGYLWFLGFLTGGGAGHAADWLQGMLGFPCLHGDLLALLLR
jgi:hypothetical protein